MATQQTLPLFNPDPRSTRVRRLRTDVEPQGVPVGEGFAATATDRVAYGPEAPPPVDRPGPGREISPHLLAARKLSRKIRRLPDHSEIQTRTGQAICQHLRMMLNEMPAASESDHPRPESH